LPRPMKKRQVCALPQTREFLPCGRKCDAVVELGVDEFEALRLIDYLRLTQDDCAAQMNVARTTVQAVYNAAREKVADALVNGKRLVITGGCYNLCADAQDCCGRNCVRRSCETSHCGRGCPCHKTGN